MARKPQSAAGAATLFADAPEHPKPTKIAQTAKRQEVAVSSPTKRRPIAKHDAAEPAPVNMLAVLVQLASDPRVPTEKMRDILDMQKEIRAEEARRAFTTAKIRMRPELPIIDARGRIVIPAKKAGAADQKTPFPKWFDLNQAIKPILDRHGFDLWFEPSGKDGKLAIIGHLDHVEGHSVTSEIPLTIETSGSKNNVMGVGSSLSYGKRYATVLMLNLDSKAAPEIDDDSAAAGKMIADNRAAGRDEEIEGLTKKQLQDLRAAIADCGVGEETFCGKYEINNVEALPPRLYGEAMTACRNFKANNAKSKEQNG